MKCMSFPLEIKLLFIKTQKKKKGVVAYVVIKHILLFSSSV